MEIITRQRALAIGAKRYFTGKPCCRGHIASHFVGCGTCCQCSRERRDRWARANRERLLAYNHSYNAMRPERIFR
jgi:hypothetical protein